eukprot:4896853-Prorocentrum_lima.AAC.1
MDLGEMSQQLPIVRRHPVTAELWSKLGTSSTTPNAKLHGADTRSFGLGPERLLRTSVGGTETQPRVARKCG